MAAYIVKQPCSLRIKVEGNQIADFDLNQFIELFLPQGPLYNFQTDIFGITTFNYLNKVFTVTFHQTTATDSASTLMNFLDGGREFVTARHKTVKLFARRPPPPTETITLYPMPHGITHEIVQNIAKDWGQLKSFDYGRHKLLPQVRNSYLHVKFTELKPQNIPQRILVNQHFVAVIKPGENISLRCGFCKLKDHKLVDCPERSQPTNNFLNRPRNPQNPWNMDSNNFLPNTKNSNTNSDTNTTQPTSAPQNPPEQSSSSTIEKNVVDNNPNQDDTKSSKEPCEQHQPVIQERDENVISSEALAELLNQLGDKQTDVTPVILHPDVSSNCHSEKDSRTSSLNFFTDSPNTSHIGNYPNLSPSSPTHLQPSLPDEFSEPPITDASSQKHISDNWRTASHKRTFSARKSNSPSGVTPPNKHRTSAQRNKKSTH